MAQMDFRQSKAVYANIEYIAARFGLDRTKLAAVMSISDSVLYKRIPNPETFRLEELERLAAWSTKHGFPVTLGELLTPFVVSKQKPVEVSA